MRKLTRAAAVALIVTEIHEAEALGIFVPYGSPTGWG